MWVRDGQAMVVQMPATSMLSLREKGIPKRGGRDFKSVYCATSASAARMARGCGTRWRNVEGVVER